MSSGQLPPEVQHKLMKYQQLRDQLQYVLVRKQQLELEQREVERALEELKKLEDNTPVYKFTGLVLYKADKKKLVEELTDRAETISLRLKTLENQEKTLKEELEELRRKLQVLLPRPGEGSAGAG